MKKYDLVVKTGQTKNGKTIWKNVGAMLDGNNGPYIVLDQTFNPAGVQGQNGSIYVSLFEPKGKKADAFEPEFESQEPTFSSDEDLPF